MNRDWPIADTAPDALIVGQNGVIIHASPRAAAVTGYTVAELEGMAIENLVPEDLRDRHVALREGFERDGQPRTMGQGRLIIRLRQRSGEYVKVIAALEPVTSSVGARATAVWIRLSTVVDIDEEKLAKALVRWYKEVTDG